MDCFVLFQIIFAEKSNLHSLQEYGFTPECLAWWFLNPAGCKNDLLHMEQSSVFFLLCVSVWLLRLWLLRKDFPHMTHGNGFSPAWNFAWYDIEPFESFSPHTGQLTTVPGAWISLCFESRDNCENIFPHSEHLWGFSSEWISLWWLFNSDLRRHIFWQMWHMKDVFPSQKFKFSLTSDSLRRIGSCMTSHNKLLSILLTL